MKSSKAFLHCRFVLWGGASVLASLTLQSVQSAPSFHNEFAIETSSADYTGSLDPESAGSGFTYWQERDKYLVLDNTVVSGGAGARLIEYNPDGTGARSIVMQGFYDPEDIHWISGNTFVIAQEYHNLVNDSFNELVVIDVPISGNAMDISTNSQRITFSTSDFGNKDNKGIEAVALLGDYFYFATEDPPPSPANSWKVVTAQVVLDPAGRNGRPSSALTRLSKTGRPCLRKVEI